MNQPIDLRLYDLPGLLEFVEKPGHYHLDVEVGEDGSVDHLRLLTPEGIAYDEWRLSGAVSNEESTNGSAEALPGN